MKKVFLSCMIQGQNRENVVSFFYFRNNCNKLPCGFKGKTNCGNFYQNKQKLKKCPSQGTNIFNPHTTEPFVQRLLLRERLPTPSISAQLLKITKMLYNFGFCNQSTTKQVFYVQVKEAQLKSYEVQNHIKIAIFTKYIIFTEKKSQTQRNVME